MSWQRKQLGWTCVGLVDEQQPDDITDFAKTYFVTKVSSINAKILGDRQQCYRGKFTIM